MFVLDTGYFPRIKPKLTNLFQLKIKEGGEMHAQSDYMT